MSSPLLEHTAHTLSHAGIQASSRLCCALSGGLDSVTLLHLLVRLQPHFGYHLEAAHVHHGLSPNANHWQHFCETLCARENVPLSVARVTLPAHPPDGIEAAARHARHTALGRIQCDWILFAHHQDDQAETLLFRLLRGTGTRGAGGMSPRTPPTATRPGYLRPLLSLRRHTLLAFAQAEGFEWIEDESNTDTRYTRNALRLRLIPALEEGFPAAVPALARAAAHFRTSNHLLDELAALDNSACTIQSSLSAHLLSRDALLALSDARLANLLRWHIHRLLHHSPAQTHLNEVLRQLRHTPVHHPLYLPLGHLACCCYRNQLWFEPHPPPPIPPAQLWEGQKNLVWGNGTVVFEPVTGEGIDQQQLLLHAQTHSVIMRTRWPGLRLQTHPQRPRHSFKNLCQEQAVPVWLRERLPVLCFNEEPVWIGGIGTASAFQCAPDQPGLRLHWHPASANARFTS